MQFGDAIISQYGNKMGMVTTTYKPPLVQRDKYGKPKAYVFEWVEMEELSNGHWTPIRGATHLAGQKAWSSYITYLGTFEHGNLMPRFEYLLKHANGSHSKSNPHSSYVGPWGYDYKGQLSRKEAEERRKQEEAEAQTLHNTWKKNFEQFFGASADAVRSHLTNS